MKILHQPWGGLGDNLQYSTLPERFSRRGFDVYISEKNQYRCGEIHQLVWGINPFVKGISGEKHNIGETGNYKRIYADKSIVFNQEACHGLDPENEIPKIYYKPKLLPELLGKVLVDISAKSHDPFVPEKFSEYLKSRFQSSDIIRPIFHKNVDSKKLVDQFDGNLVINSIFDFCDTIYSCEHFVCSFSGQSLLASALRREKTTCFIRPEWKNIDYCFPNINYEVIDR